MKPFLFVLVSTFLFSASAFADAENHSTWSCKSSSTKKVLGIWKDDDFNSDYWVTLSDEDTAEEWMTDRTWFPSQPEIDVAATNAKSTLTLRMTEKDKTLTARIKQHAGGTSRWVCTKDNSKDALAAAQAAAAGFVEKWEAIDAINSPRTLSEFKSMLRLARRRTGISKGDQLPFPLPDLTIEFQWDETPSDKELKTARIRQDATDAISKRLKVKEWDHEGDLLLGEDNPDGRIYRFYRTDSQAFTDRRFGLGAAKFVRYEIVEASTFGCEDFYVDHESYTWVLVDGSTFSFSPTLECD